MSGANVDTNEAMKTKKDLEKAIDRIKDLELMVKEASKAIDRNAVEYTAQGEFYRTWLKKLWIAAQAIITDSKSYHQSGNNCSLINDVLIANLRAVVDETKEMK